MGRRQKGSMDVRTLLLLMALVLVSRSVLLAYVWRKMPDYVPVRWWAAGSGLMAFGVLLIGLREILPPVVSVLLGQASLIAGWSWTAVGTMRAAGKEPPIPFWAALALLSIGAAAWFFAITPHFGWRTVAVSVPGLVFDGYAFWACYSNAQAARQRGTMRVLGWMSVLSASALMARNAHVLYAGIDSVLVSTWEVSAYHVVSLVTLIASSVLYVLLAAEKIQDDLDREMVERERIAESMRLASLVFHTTDESMIVTSADGSIVNVNPAFTELTGYSRAEVLGRTPRVLKSDRQGDAFFASLWRTLLEQGKWQGEIWNRHKEGHVYAVRMTINSLKNADGSVQCHVALCHDITNEKVSAEKIFHQANHDRLTGLANRYAFFERLANELSRARRTSTRVGLLFMDLNRFKPVNDQYGHEAGDIVLKTVAQRWQGVLRAGDTLARMGGDEFALLVPGVASVQEAGAVAHKLLRVLQAPIELPGDQHCEVGTSVGIATYPDNAAEMDSLIAAADAAMYLCKGRVNGGVEVSTAANTGESLGANWVVFEDIHRVGVLEIDHQHMRLVTMVNAINRAVVTGKTDAELRLLFAELIEFAVEHFATEHRYMASYGYPELAQHDAQHEQLSSQLLEIFQRFEPGDEIRMLQTTKDWLMGHIMNADKQMGVFLQARGVS